MVGPGGAAAAVLQLTMVLLQPMCTRHAWRGSCICIVSHCFGKSEVLLLVTSRGGGLINHHHNLEVALWEKKTVLETVQSA
jgi:hypothetical protein